MNTKISLKPTSTFFLLLIFHNLIWVSFCLDHDPIALKGIDVGHPAIEVTPDVPIHSTSQGSKDIKFCERVPVHGISRIKLQNYAKAYRVMVVPSVVIPDKWHSKIHICFHRNASLGLCQCEQDGWKSVYKGLWSSTMSTYEQRFIDVKFVGGVSGSVTVTLRSRLVVPLWIIVDSTLISCLSWRALPPSIESSNSLSEILPPPISCHASLLMGERRGLNPRVVDSQSTALIHLATSAPTPAQVSDEVSQGWRYVLLAVGTTLLFVAPVVSEWVPFYYTSSMAIGVFAVVLIILYQGMKLLPTGRKSAFYLSMYTSLLGAGSFLVHYVAVFVNSILSNFGFSQEMQNPVSVFLLLLIILLGAGLGYWLVRKYVISEDGDVDDGVAQFIKWAMRVIAVTCIFLSSIDTPLATAAVITCLTLYYVVTSIKWQDAEAPSFNMPNMWQWSGQRTPKVGRAEFLSRRKNVRPFGNQWNAPRSSAWSGSDPPVKGEDRGSTGSEDVFYSTFHRTPNRKRFSKKEWEEFTEESTRDSVNDLTSTPEFTEWVIKNAYRIKLLPHNGPDDLVSGTGSTDGYLVKKAKESRFFG